jgi:paraquat-inducible protein B
MGNGKATAVGAFVLGGIVLAVLAVVLFGGTRLFTRTVHAVVVFKGSIAGLSVGAPVTFRGVQIGTVDAIRLQIDPANLTALIPVYLSIDPDKVSWRNVVSAPPDSDLTRAVAGGLRAQLKMQSLVTGQLVVDLDYDPGTPAVLMGIDPKFEEIPAIPSDMERLRDELTQLNLPALGDKLRDALGGIEKISDLLASRVGPMTTSIQQTADAAHHTLDDTDAAVLALQKSATKTLLDIDSLVVEGHKQIAVSGGQLAIVLQNTARDTAQAEAVLKSLRDLTAPYSPARMNLEASLRDLAASSASLRDLTRDLARHPTATLIGGRSK